MGLGTSGLDCPHGKLIGWEVGKVIGSASTDSRKLADQKLAANEGPGTALHPLLQCWASVGAQ